MREWESLESWNWVAQRLAHTILLVPKALGMPRRRPIMDGLRAYMAYAAAAFAGWVRAAWLSAWVARRCWSHARSAVHTTPRTPGTGTDTAVLLRWLTGNRSRAVLLGPEVTSSSVQSLTTAAVHHTVLYVLGGHAVAGAAQHSTAQYSSAVIEMSVSHCFAAHSVAGSAGESRRSAAAQSTRRQPCLELVGMSFCVSLSV